MAIRRMINTRTVEEFREFQTRMIPFGRIRTGVYETPPGKRGRPAKLDRFRFTSPDRDVITAVAAEYGGTVEAFTAQGVGKNGWQVTSDADRIPVYIVNGQKIDPCYEAWAGGGRCIRRCDGEWDVVSAAPCVCNGLDPERPRPALKDMCKLTTRVNLMLPVIEGIGTWLYESHGENFAVENGGVLAAFVAGADVSVPAWFCLEPEVRQYRRDDGTYERREFFVARFRITALTPEQIALGGDVVSQILMKAGAPAALSGGARQAIGAAPVSTPADVPPTEPQPQPATARGTYVPGSVSAEEKATILGHIERAETTARLDGMQSKLRERGITDADIIAAWKSKRAAIVADREIRERAADPVAQALAGGRAFFDGELDVYDLAVSRGADHAAIVAAGGPTHWLATDDQVRGEQERALDPDLGREYAVGDTVTVGGIEFTKISDNPFPLGSPGAAGFEGDMFEAPVEGDVEEGTGPGSGLPMVPDDGTYTVAGELPKLMMLAGQRNPPWTTDQVREVVVAAFDLKIISDATGLQLARVAEAMRQGIL